MEKTIKVDFCKTERKEIKVKFPLYCSYLDTSPYEDGEVCYRIDSDMNEILVRKISKYNKEDIYEIRFIPHVIIREFDLAQKCSGVKFSFLLKKALLKVEV